MQYFQSIGGIRVLASKPEDASPDFIQEAKKRGLILYEAKTYDSSIGMFGEPIMYFGNAKGEQIVGHSDYLVLFGDKEWIILDERFFNEAFASIGNSETLPNPPTITFVQKLKGKSFYLDPGHGGHDSGATNNSFGLKEKIAALEIGLKLRDILKQNGASVYYSRQDDTFVSISARAAQANQLNVNAFVSIHLNAAENTSASGIETLCYSKTSAGYPLAEIVQKNLIAATGWKNRGVKERPDLGVLRLTKMAAILVECGFISNDAEAQSLFNPFTQNEIAIAIAEGIITQFGD